MGVRIIFGDYEFSATGRTQFGRNVTYEADTQGGVPRRALVEWVIEEWFSESNFADNQARLDALNAALAVPEGLLCIIDETGRKVYEVLARPGRNNLPAAWNTTFVETSIRFTSREEYAYPPGVSFTPNGGKVICLDNPTDWKESIRVERYSTGSPNRKEAIATITCSGKIMAPATPDFASELARRGWLEALKERIEACADCKAGTLSYDGFVQTVRVENFQAEIKEGESLVWTLTAFYRRFNPADYAEAEFEFGQAENLSRNEIITRLSGRIKSDTEEGARRQATEIFNKFSGGRLLRDKDLRVQQETGTDGQSFIELHFSYDFRELGASTSYQMEISERADTKTGQMISTYSGSVFAPNIESAQARARQLGDGKYPVRLSATEMVIVLGINSVQQLVELRFAYEYTRNGTWRYAEAASEPNRETFGPWLFTVSGYAVAATESEARALARSFKVPGLLRSEKENTHSILKDNTQLFQRVDFNYSYAVPHENTSIAYKRQVTNDYLNQTTTTTYTGSAYGPSEKDTGELIASISRLGDGVWLRKDERSPSYESAGKELVYLGTGFSITAESPLAVKGVLESEYTVETIGKINHDVITLIPYGWPHVQTGCGWTAGEIVVTGSCTASDEATATQWGQALRGRVQGGGCYEQPPKEAIQQIYYPLSGATIKSYRFSFNYRAAVVN